jgi:hypothetical protein
LQAVNAHGALRSLFIRGIPVKHNRPIWTGFPAPPAPLALAGVNENSSIEILFIKSMIWTGFNTNGFLAMIAGDGKRVKPCDWERTFFPLIDPHPFLRTRRKLIPLLAGYCAFIASDASTLIEIEPILDHFFTPLPSQSGLKMSL